MQPSRQRGLHQHGHAGQRYEYVLDGATVAVLDVQKHSGGWLVDGFESCSGFVRHD